MELDRFTGRFPHTRHTPETSEIVTLPHQMATDYVWLKTQIGLIPSGIPALARIWLKTRLDSKSSESNLVRVRVPPLVLFETRGLRDFLLADSEAYNFKCPLFVPRLLSGRCHDDVHTGSNLVYQDALGLPPRRSRSYS